jgi:hypothetical protein
VIPPDENDNSGEEEDNNELRDDLDNSSNNLFTMNGKVETNEYRLTSSSKKQRN